MSNYFTDYDVISEEEALNLLPKGDYPEAWIRDVTTKESKSTPGKINVILTVDVYDSNGIPNTIIHGLYFKGSLREVCEAIGCLSNYENKTLILDEHIKGKDVSVYVNIQKAQNGFKAKNVISSFRKPTKPTSAEIRFVDDEITL